MARDVAHIRSIVAPDGAVILDIRNDLFFGTNATGAYIWSRLVRGDDVDRIAMDLSRDTGTELGIVIADVAGFVAALHDRHLFGS